MEAAPTVDHVVLLSGDGDFALLLRKIIDTYGLTTEVYGVRDLTARSLIEASTNFYPIESALLL